MTTNGRMKMRILLLCLSLLLGVANVQPAMAQVVGQPSIDFPMQDQLAKTAKEILKAYETGDWETLRQEATENAIFHNLGSYDSLTIDQTIKYWKKGRESATPILSEDGVWLGVSIAEGARKGNWVLHWGTNSLSYPNGEIISYPYHVALKFEGNKVSAALFYYDNNKIIRALGYEIQPPFEEEENEDPSAEIDGNKKGS